MSMRNHSRTIKKWTILQLCLEKIHRHCSSAWALNTHTHTHTLTALTKQL